jgi:hypothetical protein
MAEQVDAPLVHGVELRQLVHNGRHRRRPPEQAGNPRPDHHPAALVGQSHRGAGAVAVEVQVLAAAGPVQGHDQRHRLARLHRLGHEQPHRRRPRLGRQRQPELAGPPRAVVALLRGHGLSQRLGLGQQPGGGVVGFKRVALLQAVEQCGEGLQRGGVRGLHVGRRLRRLPQFLDPLAQLRDHGEPLPVRRQNLTADHDLGLQRVIAFRQPIHGQCDCRRQSGHGGFGLGGPQCQPQCGPRGWLGLGVVTGRQQDDERSAGRVEQPGGRPYQQRLGPADGRGRRVGAAEQEADLVERNGGVAPSAGEHLGHGPAEGEHGPAAGGGVRLVLPGLLEHPQPLAQLVAADDRPLGEGRGMGAEGGKKEADGEGHP